MGKHLLFKILPCTLNCTFNLPSEFAITSVVNLWTSFNQSSSMKKFNTCKSTATRFQTVIIVLSYLLS